MGEEEYFEIVSYRKNIEPQGTGSQYFFYIPSKNVVLIATNKRDEESRGLGFRLSNDLAILKEAKDIADHVDSKALSGIVWDITKWQVDQDILNQHLESIDKNIKDEKRIRESNLLNLEMLLRYAQIAEYGRVTHPSII